VPSAYEHPSYSQFVDAPGAYLELNRMVDVLELYKIARAGDGARADEHLDDLLTPDRATQARMLTRLEVRRGPLVYAPSSAVRAPHSFAILSEMARTWDKATFVEALMGPSGVQLPFAERLGVTAPAVDAAELARTFARDGLVQFAGPFDGDVLGELAAEVARAPFRAMRHSSLGVDYTMDAAPTQALLHYLVGDRRFIALLERIAGVPPGTFVRFSGRVYRMLPGRDGDSYHSDVHLVDKRLVAISVSLEPEAPAGGELVMRRKSFLRPFVASRPAALGGVVMFRISRFLEHKVAAVTRGARTNLAGWLCPAPDYDYSSWVDRPLFADDTGPRWRWWLRRLCTQR
jgi:hypothetical protein